MKILVTGITGFLGKEFLKSILEDTQNEYVLVIRSASLTKIASIVEKKSHITMVKGSLKNTLLFNDPRLFDRYSNEINKVVHLAALYDLGASPEELYLANVVGTQNVLYFCRHCTHLVEIDYASTIAVAGNWSGFYAEDDFDLGQEFDNAYAKTKFQAEALVRQFSDLNPQKRIRVLRFGVIVGNSQTGAISKTDGPYYFFNNIARLFQMLPPLKKLSFVPFPFKADAIFPLVPVDTAAALLACGQQHDKGIETIHCLARSLPTMETFLHDFLRSIDVSLTIIALPRHKWLSSLLPKVRIPKALVEYLYMPTKFECHRIDKALPQRPTYSELKAPLFNYVKESILKRPGQ